jgi:predicted kinase
MTTPALILVTGLPATGKSRLTQRLAADLALSLVGKDEIKELLFDTLGIHDRAWSQKLGGASFDLLYWSLGKLLAAGRSVLVDADFSSPARASERLAALHRAHPYRALVVSCVCAGETLFARFQVRALSGERHAGHVDHQNFDEFRAALLRGRREPLGIPATTIEVDTSDFASLPYDGLRARIQSFIS